MLRTEKKALVGILCRRAVPIIIIYHPSCAMSGLGIITQAACADYAVSLTSDMWSLKVARQLIVVHLMVEPQPAPIAGNYAVGFLPIIRYIGVKSFSFPPATKESAACPRLSAVFLVPLGAIPTLSIPLIAP